MITAFTYIFTAITLSVLLVLTRSAGHEILPDSEVFRYQSGRIKAVLACVPVPILCGVFIYVVTEPKMEGASLFSLMLLCVLVSIGFYFSYKSFKEFSVEASISSLIIHKLKKTRVIKFDDVKKITLIEGGKGALTLSLFDIHNRKLIEIGDSIEDIRGLAGLIRMRAAKLGAIYSYRDRWGKWS